jgi:type I restriction enzyme S subunit
MLENETYVGKDATGLGDLVVDPWNIEVRPRYLLWMFKARPFRRFVDSLNTGSLIQHMFTSQLEAFPVPLPPLLEQDRIVKAIEEHISIIDAARNAVEATILRATHLRQAILKWAFEGKLVDQDPTDEPASLLLERIRSETVASGPGPRNNGKGRPARKRRRGSRRAERGP